MSFTDLFIRRPVLAVVVSLLILLVGAKALIGMPVQQYPSINATSVKVTTVYPGADPELVQGFVTTPLQQAIASANGVDFITSTSVMGASIITFYAKLSADPEGVLAEVISKVAQVRSSLPKEALDPMIEKSSGNSVAAMYLGFYSKELNEEQITEYLSRVIQPKLATVSGVSGAQLLGGKQFAMRVWLSPERMASHGIAIGDLAYALGANNYLSAAGQTGGRETLFDIHAATGLTKVDDFARMAVRNVNGATVRLSDVAVVELGPGDTGSNVVMNGDKAVLVALNLTPGANPLKVVDDARALLPSIEKALPPSLKMTVVYDGSLFIRSSIEEVIHTLVEAMLIVIVVIFFFIGSFRAVVIPLVTIPLSLIGVCFIMAGMGFSINLLTLLAMVLAIGLVVDDAIVVVENVERHMAEGLSAMDASLKGAREIVGPVIGMTITLAAVYAPIGFMGGLTGALFREFALTLAGAVVISGIVALTLSPMMCSRLLKPQSGGFSHKVEHFFERLRLRYQRMLSGALDYPGPVLLLGMAVLLSIYPLFLGISSELAPEEDQGIVLVSAQGPPSTNLAYLSARTSQIGQEFDKLPETESWFMFNGNGVQNQGFGAMVLKPWEERKRNAAALQNAIQESTKEVPGLQSFAFQLPSLPGASGLPVQFVVNTTETPAALFENVEKLKAAARASGLFAYVSSDLEFSKPQIEVNIDREKSNALGVSMQDIGQTMGLTLGGVRVNRFAMDGRAYDVIPQLPPELQQDPGALGMLRVRAADGGLVTINNFATFDYSVQPSALNQFNQLNAATIQAVPVPGVTLGEALDFLTRKTNELMSPQYRYDFAGPSRQFIQEGNALAPTFALAIVLIFLVLAAQFESFRDPAIIMICVPMSICGALIPLYLGMATLNIYTQIGLVTLVGLITKHGILMVEFANKIQEEEGRDRKAAVLEAAGVRLRAILMTTSAMVVGLIPLLKAAGAGANSRFSIGLVIVAGMTIGTLFTLFIVPTVYSLLAGDHRRPEPKDSQA